MHTLYTVAHTPSQEWGGLVPSGRWVVPQRGQLHLVQNAHVLVGQQVDHKVVAVLKGIDVVEAEKRFRTARTGVQRCALQGTWCVTGSCTSTLALQSTENTLQSTENTLQATENTLQPTENALQPTENPHTASHALRPHHQAHV